MGKVITLTGASGAGKTTIARKLIEEWPDFHMVRSITTRKPRTTDVHGEYMYISENEMDACRETKILREEQVGDLLWEVNVHGNRYATLRIDIERALKGNGVGIMILTPDAIEKVQKEFPEVISFYVVSPSRKILEKRLKKRGDNDKDIQIRIEDCLYWDRKAFDERCLYNMVSNEGRLNEVTRAIFNRTFCS